MSVITVSLLVFACFGTWTEAIRPSTIDIKGLELLYRIGLEKTNELIRQQKYPIENIISNGKLNITQQIKESQDRVSSSLSAQSECAKLHSSSLSQINPEELHTCRYNQIFDAALNNWNAVKAHILFCSISSDNACVRDIKEEIKTLEASNDKQISEVWRSSENCKNNYCEKIVGIIAEIDQSFFNCVH